MCRCQANDELAFGQMTKCCRYPWGDALLRELIARDARAALNGDGSITLTATRSLDARVSGSGTILYGGNAPRVTPTVTGSGTFSAE